MRIRLGDVDGHGFIVQVTAVLGTWATSARNSGSSWVVPHRRPGAVPVRLACTASSSARRPSPELRHWDKAVEGTSMILACGASALPPSSSKPAVMIRTTRGSTFTSMGSSVGEDLSAQLRSVHGGGSFATRRTAPIGDLAIQVTDVGELSLPVTAAQARQLRLVARPAKYGRGEQTNPSTRQSVTPGRSRGRGCGSTSVAGTARGPDARHDSRRPGLARGELAQRPVLHSMRLYERGQFFAAHQDSEKNDEMVATLVVMLPSRSTGGELVVSHRGESVRYRGSVSSLTFVAFYADTRH